MAEFVVKNDETENSVQKFPYEILNNMAMKLKAAKEELAKERKFYEAKIANMLEIVSSRDASNILNDDVAKLKQRISDLVYENNRYHLTISNCTFCSSDDPVSSNAPSTCSDTSIEASTLVPFALLGSDPALLPRSIDDPFPSPMSCTSRKEGQAKGKDKTFINKMVKTLTRWDLQ